MSKLTFASAAVLVCLAGCDQRTDSSPADDPSDVELDSTEPETDEVEGDEVDSAESGEDEGESAESESSEPDSAESEGAKPESPPEPSPPERACKDLTQKTCEVTQGCAWQTKPKGCIDQ